MIQTATDNLTEYYATVQSMGKILTPEQARLWSRSVLNLMGINMSRSAKSALAKALPEALGSSGTNRHFVPHFAETCQTGRAKKTSFATLQDLLPTPTKHGTRIRSHHYFFCHRRLLGLHGGRAPFS